MAPQVPSKILFTASLSDYVVCGKNSTEFTTIVLYLDPVNSNVLLLKKFACLFIPHILEVATILSFECVLRYVIQELKIRLEIQFP